MQRNVMLHVLNVMWLGGVPMFIRDMMRAYRQYHHVVCYLWSKTGFGTEDYDMMQEWEHEFGADIGHAETASLTEDIVKAADPDIVVLHCTGGKSIEGEWPYAWLNQWPTIFVHHMPTYPLLNVDLDLFVSEYMAKRYEGLRSRMKRWKVCPPVIDTSQYTGIVRKPDNKRCVIGKLCSDWNAKKYPEQLLRVMKAVGDKYSEASFEITGGAKHYKDTTIKVPRIVMPETMTKTVPVFMAGYDIFLYINDPSLPETWCRAVTEAKAAGLPVVAEKRGGIVEQIEHGVNGFLCDTDEEFIECLTKLIEDPKLRYDMGVKAREGVAGKYGLQRLRDETLDIVLGSAIGII